MLGAVADVRFLGFKGGVCLTNLSKVAQRV